MINVAEPSSATTSGTKPFVLAVVTPRNAVLNGVSGRAPLTSNVDGPVLSEANRSLQVRHALTHDFDVVPAPANDGMVPAPVNACSVTLGIAVSLSVGSSVSIGEILAIGLGETLSEGKEDDVGSSTSGVNVGIGFSDFKGGKEGNGVMEAECIAAV